MTFQLRFLSDLKHSPDFAPPGVSESWDNTFCSISYLQQCCRYTKILFQKSYAVFENFSAFNFLMQWDRLPFHWIYFCSHEKKHFLSLSTSAQFDNKPMKNSSSVVWPRICQNRFLAPFVAGPFPFIVALPEGVPSLVWPGAKSFHRSRWHNTLRACFQQERNRISPLWNCFNLCEAALFHEI